MFRNAGQRREFALEFGAELSRRLVTGPSSGRPMPAPDEHDMTQVYESADWYQSRPEPETIWIGMLEERRSGVGPDTRGGLTYVLVGDVGRLNIYAANADKLFEGFVRRSVRIRGKLVDLRRGARQGTLAGLDREGEFSR